MSVPMEPHVRGSIERCRVFHSPCRGCSGCVGKYTTVTHLCARCSPSGVLNPKFDAVREPTLEEVAWAAGIYEGEGSCNFANRTPQIRVVQKDPELLYRLQEMFGGNVRVRSPHAHTGNGIHVWDCHGARAREFARRVRPWLTQRRLEQFAAVFEEERV